LSFTLDLFFIGAGITKLSGAEWAETQYVSEGFSSSIFVAAGVIELAGGILLFEPRLRFLSTLLLLIWIAFIEAAKRYRFKKVLFLKIFERVIVVLLLVLAWLS
jgi:DoxX-like family